MGVFHSNARTIRNLDIHSKSDYVIVVYLVDEQFVVSTYLTLVFFLRTFPVFGQIPTIFFRLLTPASCQNKSIQQSLDITLFASFRCSILFGFPLTPPSLQIRKTQPLRCGYFWQRIISLACQSFHHLLKEVFLCRVLSDFCGKVLSIDRPCFLLALFGVYIFACCCVLFGLLLAVIIWLIKKLMEFVWYRFSWRLQNLSTLDYGIILVAIRRSRDDPFDGTTGMKPNIFAIFYESLKWEALCVIDISQHEHCTRS